MEVIGPNGRAVAWGRRNDADGPIAWKIEPGRLEEIVEIGIDRTLFDRLATTGRLGRVENPSTLASAIESWVQLHVAPDDVLDLGEDPAHPNVRFASLPPSARRVLMGWLRIPANPDTHSGAKRTVIPGGPDTIGARRRWA